MYFVAKMTQQSEHYYQSRRPPPIIVETFNPGYALSYTVADDEMPRRPRSAPANKKSPAGAGTSKKRAHTAEPTRSSKRLRGQSPGTQARATIGEREVVDLEEVGHLGEDVRAVVDVEVLTEGWHLGGQREKPKRREFRRVLSGGSSTGKEDDDIETPVSTQSTLPTPTDPLSPEMKRALSYSWDSEPEVTAKRTASSQQQPAKRPTRPRPAYSNVVPPAVPINECPPLRIVFRNHCYYREKAVTPNAEWQSDYFLPRCTDPTLQRYFEQQLQNQGYITLPTDLLSSLNDREGPHLSTFLTDFFERYSVPGQSLPTIPHFIDPLTRTLNITRIQWWEKLSSYFRIPHYFSRIFAPNVANWHILYHVLPTFALMREFADMVDRWGLKRGAENLHQELARRVASVEGGGRVDVVVYAKLCRFGGKRLRDESKKFDGMEESWEECGVCVVRPAFKGDKFWAQS